MKHQACGSDSNICDLYLRGDWFESQQGQLVIWIIFMVVCSPSSKCCPKAKAVVV